MLTRSAQQLASHCRSALETYWAMPLLVGVAAAKVLMRFDHAPGSLLRLLAKHGTL